MAERLKEETFRVAVSQPDRLVLLDFYSDSCLPCRRLSPLLAELEEAWPALFFGKVNVAAEPALAERYEIRSVPTLVLYRNGEELVRLTGLQSRQKLEEIITQYQ